MENQFVGARRKNKYKKIVSFRRSLLKFTYFIYRKVTNTEV